MTRSSPPLASQTPNTSMMATPTEMPSSLSSGSGSSEGLFNLGIQHNDSGSLERNVSSLNIALDSPSTVMTFPSIVLIAGSDTNGSIQKESSPPPPPPPPPPPLSHKTDMQTKTSSPPRQQHTPPNYISPARNSQQTKAALAKPADHFAVPSIIPRNQNGNHRNYANFSHDRSVPQAPREQERLTVGIKCVYWRWICVCWLGCCAVDKQPRVYYPQGDWQRQLGQGISGAGTHLRADTSAEMDRSQARGGSAEHHQRNRAAEVTQRPCCHCELAGLQSNAVCHLHGDGIWRNRPGTADSKANQESMGHKLYTLLLEPGM